MSAQSLTAGDFTAFFGDLWGKDLDPFPWQSEFARRLCEGNPPDYVTVPTGCGKTACLDAAVFALAVQAYQPMAERTQGRRIFFIVNRRVIVDEAYERAGAICRQLHKAAPGSVARRVADALRSLTADPARPPLARAQLRGAVYRDRAWAGSLLQPMIVCSTVDQAGSRLLFRGYGVSPQARPIHAALVAHDSLLIIDEAHISRPFIQTLEWVEKYRLHRPAGAETLHLPFKLLQMTATPPADARADQKTTLGPGDYQHPILLSRLHSSKPARLMVEPKAKGKAREEQMAVRLTEEAGKILAENKPASLAIMVNRVATARSIAEKLKRKHGESVKLLIGRLRPLDREAVTGEIQARLKTGASASASASGPLLVVSTQCLEVGADLDFDALVTEAASLDSLRQRFGRLNRGGRPIDARAVVVLPGEQDLALDKLDEAAPCDPVYGNAIPRTWRWLGSLAKDGVVDFGLLSMKAAVEALQAEGGESALAALLSPAPEAPVLLPAYLDCWVQTNPAPAADPEVALFLHGPQRESTEVQVCWRGDLPEEALEEQWADVVSLCPPTSAESLPVPLHIFRAWLESSGKFEDTSSDVGEAVPPADPKKAGAARAVTAFVWRGAGERFFLSRAADLRPGDTIILATRSGGWAALGHLPGAPADPQSAPEVAASPEVQRVDVAEQAAASARRRAVFRVHPALLKAPVGTAAAELLALASDRESDWRSAEIKALLERMPGEEHPDWALSPERRKIIAHLADKAVRLDFLYYPGEVGMVLQARELMPLSDSEDAGLSEAGDAEALLESTRPQELCSHTRDVLSQLESTLALLPLERWREPLVAAAATHDWGKVDPRFQALLRGTTPFAAMASEVNLAKSGSLLSSAAARRAARQRAELPEGFRHEMLSVQMAATPAGKTALPSSALPCALALHLIATHHGYARPFAPLVEDDLAPEVSLAMKSEAISLSPAERQDHPAHALDSGLAERFWQMNRHYGWWGIALLETVLRLADQSASAHPGLQANL